MARIIVVVKTLNEERNIENFCRGHSFADKILVADGGSTDRTVELTRGLDNVEVRDFEQRIEMDDDPMGFMNPEPQHINFCIDWAIEEGADWIVLDGCDGWPNPKLGNAARRIMEEIAESMIYVKRLYVWDRDEVFVNLGKEPAMWAWRPSKVAVRSEEPKGATTCFEAKMIGAHGPRRTLPLPYVLLHYFYPDEATVKMKMARYAAWGHPQVHPLEAFGPRVKIPREVLEE